MERSGRGAGSEVGGVVDVDVDMVVRVGMAGGGSRARERCRFWRRVERKAVEGERGRQLERFEAGMGAEVRHEGTFASHMRCAVEIDQSKNDGVGDRSASRFFRANRMRGKMEREGKDSPALYLRPGILSANFVPKCSIPRAVLCGSCNSFVRRVEDDGKFDWGSGRAMLLFSLALVTEA